MLSNSWSSLWGLLGGSSQTEKKELFFAEEEPEKKPQSPGSESPRPTITGKYYFYDVEHHSGDVKTNIILCIGTDGILILNPANEIEEHRFELKFVKNVSFNGSTGHWEFKYGSSPDACLESHSFYSKDAKKMQEAAINTFENLLKSKRKEYQTTGAPSRSGPIPNHPKKSKSVEITKPTSFPSVPDIQGDNWTPRNVDSPTIFTRSRTPSTASERPITPDHSLFKNENEFISGPSQNQSRSPIEISLVSKIVKMIIRITAIMITL